MGVKTGINGIDYAILHEFMRIVAGQMRLRPEIGSGWVGGYRPVRQETTIPGTDTRNLGELGLAGCFMPWGS